MVPWHETLAARIGIRLAGFALLSLAGVTGRILYTTVHAHPPSQARLSELGLCAVLVVLLVVGGAMASLGAVLCRSVSVPGRWSAALVEPHRFEVLPGAEAAFGKIEKSS